MEKFLTKLSSRKFLISVAGIVSGIVLISNGNATEGVATVIASVIGYLVSEGYIDAAAVKAATDKVEEKIEEVEKE